MSDQLALAVAVAREALSAAPAGLLSDIDGTLAPVVEDPAAVALAPGAADALRALAGRLAVVGAVTGRAAADGRRILGSAALLVAGNHGTEWLEAGAELPVAAHGLEDVPRRLQRLLAEVPTRAGVTLEDKGLSATVHYRRAPDPDAARRELLALLSRGPTDGLELREGRMSIEVRPAGAGDKGTAIGAIVARHRLRGLVVLGDDVTDLDMFRAAADLRDAGTLRAALIAVGGAGEVPPSVAEAADASVASPDQAVQLLRALAD